MIKVTRVILSVTIATLLFICWQENQRDPERPSESGASVLYFLTYETYM